MDQNIWYITPCMFYQINIFTQVKLKLIGLFFNHNLPKNLHYQKLVF